MAVKSVLTGIILGQVKAKGVVEESILMEPLSQKNSKSRRVERMSKYILKPVELDQNAFMKEHADFTTVAAVIADFAHDIEKFLLHSRR